MAKKKPTKAPKTPKAPKAPKTDNRQRNIRDDKTGARAIVRSNKRKKVRPDTKVKRDALKGSKIFNQKTGKRVSVKNAMNPRTGDWRGGLRIEKGGSVVITKSGE